MSKLPVTVLLGLLCCFTPLAADWVEARSGTNLVPLTDSEASALHGAQTCAQGFWQWLDVCPFGQADNCRDLGRPCVNSCPYSCKRKDHVIKSSGTQGNLTTIPTTCAFWVTVDTCMNGTFWGCTCGAPTSAPFIACNTLNYPKVYTCN